MGQNCFFAWQSGLIVSMAARILQLLSGRCESGKPSVAIQTCRFFRENKMPIFGGISLGRVLRPFEYFMLELLSWDKIRNAVDLEGATAAQVSCRQTNGTTGPTFKFGITARQPRQRCTSAWVMSAEESQITGIQTDACSQYMQLTRATHKTVVYLHDFPCGTPGIKWK